MINKKFLSNLEFYKIYSKVPRLCIDIVISASEGVLLALRKIFPYKEKWHLPGGTVYYKESIENAVKRITNKELGIKVNIEKLIGYIEFSSEEKERGFGWTVSLVFLCKIKSGIPAAGDGTVAVKFFKNLPQNMIKEQKIFLNSVKF